MVIFFEIYSKTADLTKPRSSLPFVCQTYYRLKGWVQKIIPTVKTRHLALMLWLVYQQFYEHAASPPVNDIKNIKMHFCAAFSWPHKLEYSFISENSFDNTLPVPPRRQYVQTKPFLKMSITRLSLLINKKTNHSESCLAINTSCIKPPGKLFRVS